MTPQEVKELQDKITAGVKAGVAAALEEHRRAGRTVAVWQDGKVKMVIPAAPDDLLKEKPSRS